jgi:hypothetical protein
MVREPDLAGIIGFPPRAVKFRGKGGGRRLL